MRAYYFEIQQNVRNITLGGTAFKRGGTAFKNLGTAFKNPHPYCV